MNAANGYQHEVTELHDVDHELVCSFCGQPDHSGTFSCPRIVAIEFYEDGETVKKIHLAPYEQQMSGSPETDAAYRERLLRVIGRHSVNTEKAKTLTGADLDELGAHYDTPRR